MKVVERRSSGLSLQVDAALYSEDVVFKCFYWYGADYRVEIERLSGGKAFLIRLESKSRSLESGELDALEARAARDLLDHKTRDVVSKDTKVIRELLIAKAFAHGDEFDAPPPGDISDPVGFDPES